MYRRVLDASAIGGTLVWSVAAFVGHFATVEALFLTAPLVLVPIGLRLVETPRSDGTRSIWYRVATLGQPIGAALAVASLALEPGWLAAVLSVPWLAVTVSAAVFGATRVLPRGLRPVEELCVDAGLLYLPVGGTSLVVATLGVPALGFDAFTIFLAAVHFHFAGFVLLVVAGVSGRLVPPGGARRGFDTVAPGIVVGPGLIGLGITASPLVEVLAVVILTLAVAAVAAMVLVGAVPALDRWRERLPLAVGWAAVACSMGFALAYGVTKFTGSAIAGLDVGTMILLHGQLNVLFALLAALGLRLRSPQSRVRPQDVSFSTLAARWRVGTDYFDRLGARDDARDPTGMVDSLDDLRGPAFDPAAIHPAVRDFYEHTADYTLRVQPRVRRGFGPVARLAGAIGRRIEQLNLSLDGRDRDGALDGVVYAIDDATDRRSNVRTWTRWYADTGLAMYVATYAVSETEDVAYLNAAFPLPGGNLTGVLEPRSIGDGPGPTGFELTTLEPDGVHGSAGLYFVTRFGPVRLPLDERIRLWGVDRPDGHPADLVAPEGADVVARHEIWLAGVHVATLDYVIERTSSARADRASVVGTG